MRQTEKQKVSAGEIEETIKRKRGKESQSTIHGVKMGRMSRSEAILSHNAKEKEELEKKKKDSLPQLLGRKDVKFDQIWSEKSDVMTMPR